MVQTFLHMVHQVKCISTIVFRVELQRSLEPILDINYCSLKLLWPKKVALLTSCLSGIDLTQVGIQF